MKRWTWWGVALLGMLAVSCSTDGSTDMVFDPGDDEPVETVTFTQVQDVFAASCSCHMGGQYPNLSPNAAYASIVGAASSSGLPLIDPGNPDNSYLYLKVTGTPGISGSRMPAGGPYLTDAQLQAVAAWITRGAPND